MKDNHLKDKCVTCNEESLYDKEHHVDFRIGYIEGVGQLCLNCYDDIYNKNSKTLYRDYGDGHLEKITNELSSSVNPNIIP